MTKKMPYFSIIIPTLNEEKYIPLLLRDLTKQTNTDFEVIVVDGKSSDKTKQKILAYNKQLPLKFIQSSEGNVCAQRNLGAQNSHSPWLLFMDADNRIPTYFMQGLRYQIDKNNPSCFITLINPDGDHPLDRAIAQVINTFFQTQKNTKNPYLLESMLGIKNRMFASIGGFNESLVWSEGHELLKRLMRKKQQVFVFKEPKYTYSFRRIKKEGALKALRNSAYLILAQQTGVHLDTKMYQKYYPMKGGAYFNNDHLHQNPSQVETIFANLLRKYEIPTMIEKLNQPMNFPKNPIKALMEKFQSR